MPDADGRPRDLDNLLGLEAVIDSGSGGRAVIRYRARPEMCHSGGIVQGGFVTGWIDQAMAHVAVAATNHEFSVLTLEIKISFLEAATPGPVIAEAWIERRGKSIAFVEGRIMDAKGLVLAKASSTVRLVPVKRAR